MKIFLFVLLSILLILLVSGGYTFVLACVRRKELPWFSEQELKKTSYGKYYPNILASDKWLKDHNAQDIYLVSHDGLKLHAFWISKENAKGTIILAHGYRSTPLVDFSGAFASYYSKGLNVMVINQRAHGESEGKYITFGVKESEDLKQWINYHNAHFGNQEIILSGMSMGASTVLYLADQELPSNVKGIIADCGYSSPKAIISKVFREAVHLPAWTCIWAADLFARIVAGFSFSQKDTLRSLAASKLPVLMVHGKADDFVPCTMSEEGYRVCTSSKKLLLVEGAGHGVSYVVDKQTYSQYINDFLAENLEEFP